MSSLLDGTTTLLAAVVYDDPDATSGPLVLWTTVKQRAEARMTYWKRGYGLSAYKSIQRRVQLSKGSNNA